MPEIRIIGGEINPQRAWLFSRVSQSRAADIPVILFVPEQFTLQAERDLMRFLRLPGLLNLDVVSPSRLKSLVRERSGFSGRLPLDDAGRAMVIQQALQECKNLLVYYRHLDGLYGAVTRMDQTLGELQEEKLTPELLKDWAASLPGGARRAKLQDLARLWESYDRILAGRFDDPASSWRDTCARLPSSGLWQGTDLYVYGFDTLRPDLRELMLAAAPVCRSIHILLTMTEEEAPSGRIFQPQRESARQLISAMTEKGFRCALEYLPAQETDLNPLSFLSRYIFTESDTPYYMAPDDSISLFAAPNPTADALSVASALMSWHRKGIGWNQIAIALPGGYTGTDALLSALSRRNIPYFYQERQFLSHHGVSRLLSAALACVSGGYATEPLLEIASSGFGTLSREEGSRLTAYVQVWGIDRNRWRQPFSRGDDAAEAEALRQKLLAPLDALHDALRAASGARESVEAIYQFLRTEQIFEQLNSRQQLFTAEERYTEAIIDRQVWDLLMDLLDQLYALLDGRRPSLKEISALMRGALERASLSALPEENEGVVIGTIGHILPGQVSALILPGLNESSLRSLPASLLSDAERRIMEQRAGRAIGLDQTRMGLIMRADYIRTLSLPEKYLRVSYCLRDEVGTAQLPGEPILELRRLFPLLREEGGLESEKVIPPPDSPSSAIEGLGPLLRELRDSRESFPDPAWADALRWLVRSPWTQDLVRRMLLHASGRKPVRKISSSSALRLFQARQVSISRLESFASCPHRHFLQYGLRPHQLRPFEFTPGDAGNFFHAVLKQYMDRASGEPGWPVLSERRMNELLDRILDEMSPLLAESPLWSDALGRWQSDALMRRARHAADILTRFAANGDFQLLGTEVPFGTPEGLPPLVLTLPEGDKVALQGIIDRLDVYRSPEGDYLRVIDLKSSERTLQPARMDRGEQLQLMIYLQAAIQASPGALPAGALYYPVQDKEVNASSPEQAEDKRVKNVQFSGVALAEADVLRAMDRDRSPYSLPKALGKDGNLLKSASWALSETVLRRLMAAAVRKAELLCAEIRSGSVGPAPSAEADGSRSACTFCDFAGICSRTKSDERPLRKDMTFADVGLTMIPGASGDSSADS